MKVTKEELEFLDNSNAIESEYSKEALEYAVKAWEYMKEINYYISMGCIMKVHSILMWLLRHDIAGKLRNCDVMIGGKRKVFVSEFLLKEQLRQLCIYIETSIEYQQDKSKELHVDFEDIHPFEDGNGRVGRIIYNAHRLRLGLPIHVIHEGKEQMEYYKWFK